MLYSICILKQIKVIKFGENNVLLKNFENLFNLIKKKNQKLNKQNSYFFLLLNKKNYSHTLNVKHGKSIL